MDNDERDKLIKTRLHITLENLLEIQMLMLPQEYEREFNNIKEAIDIIYNIYAEY